MSGLTKFPPIPTPSTPDPAAAATPIAEARADLALWKAALRAVATGQEYRIGTRLLRRASIKEIKERVAYYQGEVDRLTAGRGRGMRVKTIVPLD